jgi:hypothetical protein
MRVCASAPAATVERDSREKEEDLLQVLATCAQHTWQVGCEEEREWPCMIEMNEKDGMKDDEFEHYINNSIIPLFPILEVTPGKRILLKVDNSPGCNGQDLLNNCQFRGVYIYPGLPNVTSVKQEADINYGPLKGIVWRNLAKNAMTCYAKGIAISLGILEFGLIVCSGVCPDSGITLENAFESTFDRALKTHSRMRLASFPLQKNAC